VLKFEKFLSSLSASVICWKALVNVWIAPHIVKIALHRKLAQHPRKRANATPDILERPRAKVAQLAKSRSRENFV
jgi:hypothetical protein